MENLKVGEGSLKLNLLLRAMKEPSSYAKLLENWKSFGRDLGVNDVAITKLTLQLGIGTTQLQDIPYELLSLWVADEGDKATLKALCDALVLSGIKGISESMEKKYWLSAVKSQKIRLPNKEVILEDLLENASEETYQEIYNELKKVTYTHPMQLLKDIVDPNEEINYYIPRTLTYTNQIHEDIFKSAPTEHIFLVKGHTKNELTKLSGYRPIDVSGNQFDKITVRFIVIERYEDFKRIFEKAEHPVHLIEYRNGFYVWIRSKGGLDTIQRYKSEVRTTLPEDEFIEEIMNTPPPIAVSISDSPGMGKSFLLANLALKIKRKDNSIVILIILDELAKQISHPIDSPHLALATIAGYASAGKVAKCVLEAMFNSGKHNYDLLLDAYDEVKHNQRHTVNTLLKHLSEHPNFRIFVTTRTHLGHQLEDVLNILSYDILPFNESNQVEFLTKYWIDKHEAQRGELLENYARESLKILHEQMTDDEKGIAGIPLQCRMLGDVLGKDAERASKFVSDSTKRIRITSLFDMYKHLADLKFGKLSEEPSYQLEDDKTDYVNFHIFHSTKLLFPDWADKLKPCLNFEGFNRIDENKLYSIGLMEKNINSTNPKFVHKTFAEYLLAEFLIGNEHSICVEMIFRSIVGGSGVGTEELDMWSVDKSPSWYSMQHPVMAYFINMHLKHRIKCTPMNELVMSISQHQNQFDLEDLSKAIAACAVHDLETLFFFVMKLWRQLDFNLYGEERVNRVKDKYFRLLLHFAVQSYESEEMIKNIIEFANISFGADVSYYVYKETSWFGNEIPWINDSTPLHMAAYCGKYNIVTYLVEKYGEKIKDLKYFLHLCVIGSSGNSEFVIQDKLSIIDLFQEKARELNLNLKWLEEEFDGRSPFLQPNVHWRLLDRLIEIGVNINAYSAHYGSVLHTSGNGVNWKELIRWALSKGFELINYTDGKGETFLLKTLKQGVAIDEEAVRLLQNLGADFNSQDKRGNSVLFYALITQTTGVISKFIDYGAYVNHENEAKENAAHIVFHEHSGKDSEEVLMILNLLISKGFTLLNRAKSERGTQRHRSNNLGATPFDYMIANFKDLDNPRLFEFFHSNGYDITKLDQYSGDSKETLFHTIGIISNACIEKLIECGANVDYEDKRYENIAHAAIRNSRKSGFGSGEVISILNLITSKRFTKIEETNIECVTPLQLALQTHNVDEEMLNSFYALGANFNAEDNGGFSVLFCAIAGNQTQTILSKIIEYGADLNHFSAKKHNALHIAAYNRNSSALALFIDIFDVNSVDQYGSTPLHQLVLKDEPLDATLLDIFHERGANFNAEDNGGFSVLFCAIAGNQTQTILSKIIEYGADLNHFSAKKHNALHIAAYNRNSSALALFIDIFDVNSVDQYGSTPLHQLVLKEEPLDIKLLDLFHKTGAHFNSGGKITSVLFSAIISNQNSTIISKIIEYGSDPYYLNHKSNNALLIATGEANYSALKFLFENFVYDINAVNDDGNTPLHEVFSEENKNYCDVLKLLLKYNSKFDIICNDGNIPLVRWIIEGENPFPTLIDLQDFLPITKDIASCSLTALIQQDILLREHLINSSTEKKEVFEKFFGLLIRKGGKLLGNNGSEIDWNELNVERFKVLDQIAVETDKLQQYFLEMNIQRIQTMVHTTESNRMNFSLLVKDHNIPIETLLKGLLNTMQHDAFYRLCSELSNIIYNKTFLTDEFFSDEFYHKYSSINSIGEDKLTPLLRLVSSEKPVRVKLLKLFHKKGANFNATNHNGSVLFHAIRSNQSLAVISHIIYTCGGDAHYRDAENNNALHIAASYAHFFASKFLLYKVQNFNNVINDDGETPLHKVFTFDEKDYHDVLELLLKKKCSDFNIENNKGHIPLVSWITDGKNPIPTLLELRDLLPITNKIASTTLTAMLHQETLLMDYLINSSEQKKNVFEKFFEFLKRKGGKLLRKDGSKIEWEKVSGESFPALEKLGMKLCLKGT